MSTEKKIAEQVRVVESWVRGVGLAPPCEIPCGDVPEDVRAGVVAHYEAEGIIASWADRDGPNGSKLHALRLAPKAAHAAEG